MNLNKKGTVLDLLPYAIMLFMIMIAMFSVALIWSEIGDDPNLRTGAYENASMDNTNTVITEGFDDIFLFFFFGLGVAMVISAALVRSNAIFFISSLILFIFMILIGLFIQTAYENIIADPTYAGILTDFTKTVWVMNNLIGILIMFGALVVIAMLAGSRFTE